MLEAIASIESIINFASRIYRRIAFEPKLKQIEGTYKFEAPDFSKDPPEDQVLEAYKKTPSNVKEGDFNIVISDSHFKNYSITGKIKNLFRNTIGKDGVYDYAVLDIEELSSSTDIEILAYHPALHREDVWIQLSTISDLNAGSTRHIYKIHVFPDSGAFSKDEIENVRAKIQLAISNINKKYYENIEYYLAAIFYSNFFDTIFELKGCDYCGREDVSSSLGPFVEKDGYMALCSECGLQNLPIEKALIQLEITNKFFPREVVAKAGFIMSKEVIDGESDYSDFTVEEVENRIEEVYLDFLPDGIRKKKKLNDLKIEEEALVPMIDIEKKYTLDEIL